MDLETKDASYSILTAHALPVETWEGTMRPQHLKDYLGQEKVKTQVELILKAAMKRQEALDHILLAGPPGLGKTTLAQLIAREMGVTLHTVTGPHLDKKGDLAAVLTSLGTKDVLFIDEIHRLPKTLEEVLYSAMEDYRLDLIIGQGPGARALKIDVPRFTLIGATTRLGLLSNPLRDRFGIHLRLDYYSAQELEKILARSAKLLKIEINDGGLKTLAKRSRGTPRIANRLLRRIRDYVDVHHSESSSQLIDEATVERALDMLEVDGHGLEPLDREYLQLLVYAFEGGPVGIETLSAAMGEERDTLEEVIEPYLIQCGFIQKTPRGRVGTNRAPSLKR